MPSQHNFEQIDVLEFGAGGEVNPKILDGNCLPKKIPADMVSASRKAPMTILFISIYINSNLTNNLQKN